ncbi:MAG: sulfur carrier protein ThiS [Chlorobi bacterium]|nr:sulfur carrier protein ThiS [Chlorobiota bacterium]
MKIYLNGEEKALYKKINLSDIIVQYLNGKEPKGIAVALNETIVPKQKWEETAINESDSVEIVHAVQGG